jgi:hypothetical protein
MVDVTSESAVARTSPRHAPEAGCGDAFSVAAAAITPRREVPAAWALRPPSRRPEGDAVTRGIGG